MLYTQTNINEKFSFLKTSCKLYNQTMFEQNSFNSMTINLLKKITNRYISYKKVVYQAV